MTGLSESRDTVKTLPNGDFSFNTSTDIDLDYSCNTQTLQKCFICTGCSFGLSTL